MVRLTDLSAATFPVELWPLSCGLGETTLNLKKHNAVVDVDRGAVLSVVTSDYRLVTNDEAYEIGKRAFRSVFATAPVDVDRDMEVFRVHVAENRASCWIDLVHRKVNFNVWEQETWLPFLRIQNSYNKTSALTFELGFVRKLCSNGIIFKKEVIQYKRAHTKHKIPEDFAFPDMPDWLRGRQQEFCTYMADLRQFKVDRQQALPLMARCLGLQFKGLDDPNKAVARSAEKSKLWFKSRAPELIHKYFDELGRTAYAVVNAASDFASDPPIGAPFHASGPELQVNIGEWTAGFMGDARKPSFNLDAYLGALSMQLETKGKGAVGA